MLFRHLASPGKLSSTFVFTSRRYLSTSPQHPPHGPLNILFCGADNFSLPSLKALHDLSTSSDSNINSLTVLCRTDKYTGRGHKTLSSPPIKSFAKSLDIPALQRDTFIGWAPLSPVDLIVTVSFGLLVPGPILKAARFGGVNVHPSLLPDLRGPAPIQRALLEGRSNTGVSLQTMHPERFDAGQVLDHRTVAIPENAGVDDMVKLLGPLGAEMLAKWVACCTNVNVKDYDGRPGKVQTSSYAAKITKEDRKVDWSTWDAAKVMRYDRVLGDLWDMETYRQCHYHQLQRYNEGGKRVTFQGPWKRLDSESVKVIYRLTETPDESEFSSRPVTQEGHAVLCDVDGFKGPQLVFATSDGAYLIPTSATIEGGKKGGALPGLTKALQKEVEAAAK